MTPRTIDELRGLAPAADLRPLERARARAPQDLDEVLVSHRDHAPHVGAAGAAGATGDHPPAPPSRLRDPRIPGLLVVAVVTAAAVLLSRLIGASSLVIAVVAGAVAANLGWVGPRLQPGTRVAARQLLRVGVVLLGLRLALGDVLALGVGGLVVVAAIVGVTFVGTRWLGRRMGVSDGLSLLVATGFSICGASAIAAMDGVAETDEEEVAFAIGLVTLFGTIAMVALPLLQVPLGLDAATFGQVAGASVHDVAQVIGTAATAGDTALQSAVVVKLTRVLALAPLVALMTFALARRTRRRQLVVAGAGATAGPDAADAPAGRTPLMPWFVAGFLVAVAVRSTGLLSDDVLGGAKLVEGLLLTAAMFGLGAGVDIAKLRRLGGGPVLLGLVSWTLILGASLLGFALLGV